MRADDCCFEGRRLWSWITESPTDVKGGSRLLEAYTQTISKCLNARSELEAHH